MGLPSVFELVVATVENVNGKSLEQSSVPLPLWEINDCVEVIIHFILDLYSIYHSMKSLLLHSKSHIVCLQDSKKNQAVPKSSPPRDTPVAYETVYGINTYTRRDLSNGGTKTRCRCEVSSSFSQVLIKWDTCTNPHPSLPYSFRGNSHHWPCVSMWASSIQGMRLMLYVPGGGRRN